MADLLSILRKLNLQEKVNSLCQYLNLEENTNLTLLGDGYDAQAYLLPNNTVLKLTKSKEDAQAASIILRKPSRYLSTIYDVFVLKKNKVYGILVERLKPLPFEDIDTLDEIAEKIEEAFEDYDSPFQFLRLHSSKSISEVQEALEGSLTSSEETLLKSIEKIVKACEKRGIYLHDFHSDNIMYRGSTLVMSDFGRSDIRNKSRIPLLAKSNSLRTASSFRIPIYSSLVYLSRTKHRGINEECDRFQDLIQDVKDGSQEAIYEATGLLAEHPGLRGFKGWITPAPRSKGLGTPSNKEIARFLVRQGIGVKVIDMVQRIRDLESSRIRRQQKGVDGGTTLEEHLQSMGFVGRVAKEGILIVDDIFTTGATIKAVALTMKEYGYKGPIFGATLGYYQANLSKANTCPIKFKVFYV